MPFTRLAALTVAALVLWGSAASAGGPLRPFRDGFWSGGAYTDERTGAFTHCSAGAAYDSGVNLFVLVTGRYRWWLGFIDPKWSFAPTPRVSIKLSLDGGAAFERFATVPNGQLLLIPLPETSDLIDAFRHAAELTLDAEGQALIFKLNETPRIMDRLTACVRTSLALESSAARAAAQPARASSASTVPTAPVAGAAGSSSPLQPSSAPTGPPITASLSAAAPTRPARKLPQHAVAIPAKSMGTAPSSPTAPQLSAPAHAAPPEATATAELTPPPAPQQSATVMHSGSLSAETRSDDLASSAAKDTASPDMAGLSDGSQSAPAAKTPIALTTPAALSRPEPPAHPATDNARKIPEGSSDRSIAALPPQPPPANVPDATPQPAAPSSVPPPLAFTAVSPMTSAPPPSFSALGPQPATGTALEEVRLATEFLINARLPNAHLIVSEKPAALVDFAAVWRSEDAAGAVKVIPPGPDVSAVAIASNLIAVDPQVCKGDFTSARLRTEVGNRPVFSAVLTCNEASEERITQYFIAPRQRGGFVVFVVIRSKEAGQIRDLDRQNLERLSRAAIQAAASQG